MLSPDLVATLQAVARGDGRVTVLTGAGISAESGIPTFRGPEGYWTVGSREYHPQEMATNAMFRRDPDAVWQWYLYRMGVCARASPNAGHRAVVSLEEILGDRFTLITQNVDNLHLRAGSSPERTYQIHGNVFFMRCAASCSPEIYPIPSRVAPKEKGEALTAADLQRLCCPRCGTRSRPHVLWFDETYNEHFFRFESALRTAVATQLLIVVGTAGATNLPNQVAWVVKQRGGIIVDINIEDNPFARLALAGGDGFSVRQSGGRALPSIARALK